MEKLVQNSKIEPFAMRQWTAAIDAMGQTATSQNVAVTSG
jgi:hypothetical protein